MKKTKEQWLTELDASRTEADEYGKLRLQKCEAFATLLGEYYDWLEKEEA